MGGRAQGEARLALSQGGRAALAVALALACLLGASAPALGALRYASPGAASLAQVYGRSAPGDVVRLAAGSYGPQVVPAGSKAVTFKGAAGTKVSELDNHADNVTFDGVDVDVNFAKNAGFENHGAANVTFKNGRIGNVTDEKGAVITGPDFTFDNVVFHDVRATGSSVHNECIFALDVSGMTVRNSLFHECATMDLFFTYGHWWDPKPPAYRNITIENNVFGHSVMPEPGAWHYYSLFIADTAADGGTVDGWTVRNNTFEIAARVDHSGSGGTRWVGNLGDWNCVSGITYRYNVGKKCSGTDKSVSPASSTRTTIAPFGWVNPAGRDFHLKQGSPAIGAADPADHPVLDRDGLRRDDRPDAGAYEFGASAPGNPQPLNPTPPGSRARIRSARLRPRRICKRAKPSCPPRARLRLKVSGRTQIHVAVKRLGKRGKPRTVRRLKRTMRRDVTITIGAGPMRKGRYRVVVWSTNGGQRTGTRTLKLRVR